MRCPKCSSHLSEPRSRCPYCLADLQLTPTSTGEEVTVGVGGEFLALSPGQVFADRFTIIEKAGQGGMGVVYKAIDTPLDQEVALKLIKPERASFASYVQRFRREVRLTRQITHPNVCRVHDLGEADGILYLTMEWVEGETLRDLLRKSGALGGERALEIAEKIARALEAAHSRGIVHRDLKPENVMIDHQGEVHVMDFGLAVEQGDENITGADILVGTPRYMSPEQRRLEKVDARADLFALGLILREMLTGEPPDAAGPPGERPATSGPVAPVLRSLLAPRKEDRCASARVAGNLLGGIRGTRARPAAGHPGRSMLLWGGAAAIVSLILLAYLWLRSPEWIAFPPAGDQASSARDFHARGLHYLRERKETPASLEDAIKMFHRAVDADPRFAAAWASLGEAYWIRYEALRDDASREEAARAVEESARLEPDLPEMHHARGRGLLAQAEYEAARRELEKAVEGNPQYERVDKAWAGLGAACQQLDEYTAGLKALETAARLRPDDYRHKVSLGLFYDHFSEYEAAAGAYRSAVAQEPDSTMALNNLASALLQLGRTGEAADTLEQSLKIEETPTARSNLGNAWYFMKDYRKAADNYRRATELQPGEAVHWANLGDALKVLGDPEARAAYLEAVRLARQRVNEAPLDPTAHMRAGLYCARAGDRECALLEGRRAAEMQPRSAECLFRVAITFCLCGRSQEALDYLDKAVRMGLSRTQIENDPDLTVLHGHPRYRRILDLAG